MMVSSFHAGFFPATVGSVRAVGFIKAVFMSPTGAGNWSGDDWANAAPFTALNSMILKARNLGGGQVVLRADQGPYNVGANLSITNGGTDIFNVVRVRGVDVSGNNMKVELVNNRAVPWVKGAAYGSDTLWLNSGANHLHFSFIRFRNVANCIRVRQDITNLKLTDCEAINFARFVTCTVGGTATTASIGGFHFQRCTGKGHSKQFIQIRYDSHNGLVEDCETDGEFQDLDDFQVGYQMDGTAHDVDYYRCKAINMTGSLRGYWQGDGFSTEELNYNINYYDCYAAHCADGGWDCKSPTTNFYRWISEDNKRNYRLWGSHCLYDCIGRNPYKRGGSGGAHNLHAVGKSDPGYCRVYGGSFTQTNSSAMFFVDVGGFLAITARTIISKPSAAPLTLLGEDGIFVPNLNENDFTPPVLSSSTSLSWPENKPGKFLFTANEPFAMRVVGGPDKNQFSKFGRNLTMKIQDYENPIDQGADRNLQVTVRLLDQNGNYSDHNINVTITDVADDPITPEMLFNPVDGATGGYWYEIADLNTVFQDDDGFIPAEVNMPVRLVYDKSRFGNHLRFDIEDRQPLLKTDGVSYWLEATGYEIGRIGGPGSLRFAQSTTWGVVLRTDEAENTQHLYAILRSATLSTTSNSRRSITFLGNTTVRYQVNGNNYGVDNALTTGRVGVISSRHEVASLKVNGATLATNAVPVATSTYPVPNGQPIMFARGVPGAYAGAFEGRYYGGAETNRTETDEITFRVERQLGFLGGLAL